MKLAINLLTSLKKLKYALMYINFMYVCEYVYIYV